MTKKLSLALALAGLLSSFTTQAGLLTEPVHDAPSKLEIVVVESTVLVGSTEKGMATFGTCAGCHGLNGEGSIGPALKALTKEETSEKLNNYRDGLITNPMAAMMTPIAQSLSDQDIADLSSYIATLKKI